MVFLLADRRRRQFCEEQGGQGRAGPGRSFEIGRRWAPATQVLKSGRRERARYFLLKTTDSSLGS